MSLGFSKQEYWSGLPCPPPEDLPDPGIGPAFPVPPADRFLPLGYQLRESRSVMPDSLWPYRLYSELNWHYTVHGILQARTLELGSLSLLQGIFPTQGLNPGLPPCRQILYQLSHKRRPLSHQESPHDNTSSYKMLRQVPAHSNCSTTICHNFTQFPKQPYDVDSMINPSHRSRWGV